MLSRRVVLRLGRRDGGRAIVEFIFLGVLLLVPMIYLVIVLARVQSAAFAVSTASREAGRAFTTAADDRAAYLRGQAAAALPLEDFGFGDVGVVQLTCDASPCLRPEGRVTAVVTVTVSLPFVPDFLADALPTVIPISATHVATVDRFAARPTGG
ncbi:MAG: pilus assembly protein [Lapillicoccus sp.]